MEINFRKINSVLVVGISGRLEAATAEDFKNRIKTIYAEEKKIVFDFTSVDFLDSTGLGVIVSSLKELTTRGGSLKIANLNLKTKMVFEITNAYIIFDIFEDLQAALNSF